MRYSLVIFFALIALCSAACPSIKTKKQWGARPELAVDYQTIPVNYVIIHHTVSQKCSTFNVCSKMVKNIQDYHMDTLEYDDIGYNFLIGNDGNVYEGCGWHVVGAHTYGYNRNSTAIAFLGNFDDELPSSQALRAAKKLLSCGVETGELSKRYRLLGGRQVISTASPGLKLYNEIQDWGHWVPKP